MDHKMIAKCLVVMAVLADTAMVFSKMVDPLYEENSEINNTQNNIENNLSLSTTSQINEPINATVARGGNNADGNTTILNDNTDIINNAENGTLVNVGNSTVTGKKILVSLADTKNIQEKGQITKTDIKSSDTLVNNKIAENTILENVSANFSTEMNSSDTLVKNTIAENTIVENVSANFSTEIKSSDILATKEIDENKTLENVSVNVSTEIKQMVAKPNNFAISTGSQYNNNNLTTELIKNEKPILQESAIKLSTTTKTDMDSLQSAKNNLTTEIPNPIKAQIDQKSVTVHSVNQLKEVEPTKKNQYSSTSTYESAEGRKLRKVQTVALLQGGKKWKREMKENETDKNFTDEKMSTVTLMPIFNSKNGGDVTNDKKGQLDMNNKNMNVNKVPDKKASTFFTNKCNIELLLGIVGIIGAGLFFFLTL